MAKLLLDLLNGLMNTFPLFTSLAITLGLVLLCSKSIKTHTGIYYGIFSIPTVLALVHYVGKLTGTLDLYSIPVIGDVVRTYTYMLPLGLPLLLIIMFTGAFKPRSYMAKKLQPIRQELSILSGFPVLTHMLFKLTYTFPHSFAKLFILPDPLPEGRIFAETGYQIGIFMSILYLLLWVTSFTAVRKKLGGLRWKKVQRWAYLLYGLIYVHSILLNLGWIFGGRTPVASYDRRPEWTIAIISMTILYALYLVLKVRKHRSSQPDRFSAYF